VAKAEKQMACHVNVIDLKGYLFDQNRVASSVVVRRAPV